MPETPPRRDNNNNNIALGQQQGGEMIHSAKKPKSRVFAYENNDNNTNLNPPDSPLHPPRIIIREVDNDDDSNDNNKIFSPHYLHTSNSSQESISSADVMDIDTNINGASPSNGYTQLDDDNNNNHIEYEEQDEEEEFNPYLFLQSLQRHAYRLPLPNSMTHLPPKAHNDKPTLVLDLDETLVHCSIDERPSFVPDFCIKVDFNEMTYDVKVSLRPHVVEFLSNMSNHFEVILFTASQMVYAEKLLNKLEELADNREIFTHRLYRDSCLVIEQNYIKDLRILGPTRPLTSTLLVDNSPHAFGYDLDNGVPIESWFGDNPADKELLKLQTFLMNNIYSQRQEDIRPAIRHVFKMQEKVNNAR